MKSWRLLVERKHLIIKKYSCEGRNIKYKKPHFKRSEAFLIDGLSHPEITMIKPSFSSHLDATNNIFIIKPSFNKSIFVTLNYRMSSKLLSSPLQGFTDFRFRNAFNHYFGGIDTFYSPYIRL